MLWAFQTHLTFGKEFTQAVELKQVAQQEAERAKFLVEKVGAHISQRVYYLLIDKFSVYWFTPYSNIVGVNWLLIG